MREAGGDLPDEFVCYGRSGRGLGGCIEYTALINIRPSHGNRSMEIQDPAVKERVRKLTSELIGDGEPI